MLTDAMNGREIGAPPGAASRCIRRTASWT
jgi:hypothetical protein